MRNPKVCPGVTAARGISDAEIKWQRGWAWLGLPAQATDN